MHCFDKMLANDISNLISSLIIKLIGIDTVTTVLLLCNHSCTGIHKSSTNSLDERKIDRCKC